MSRRLRPVLTHASRAAAGPSTDPASFTCESSECKQTLEVYDDIAPTINSATASLYYMTPPNGTW